MTKCNHLHYILFVAAILSAPPALAQQPTIDANRMNRDINIMENILQEMFKTGSNSLGGTAFAYGGDFNWGSNQDIRGTFLPGYGVIFTIPHRNSLHIINVEEETDGKEYSYSFTYGGDGSGSTQITEESVIDRISEFLGDYGSTIGQLGSDDRVMVVFGTNKSRRTEFFVGTHADAASEPKALPTISVVARKSDLQAYRSGNISEQQFRDQLSVATTDDSAKQLDMEVMANIFETAFKEPGDKAFRIRGSVNHLRLDNFGALFFFDATYTSGGSRLFSFGDAPSISVWSNGGEENRVEITKKMEERTAQLAKEEEEKIRTEQKQVSEAYRTFKEELREFIVDYGRTIKSVEAGQHLMVSVSLNSPQENIPERLDLRIEKSVLQAMDRGQLTREDALVEVAVTEY